jgi:hypothetical protein
MAKSIIAQSAKERRMVRILAEAEDRYRNEILDDEERMLLLDRTQEEDTRHTILCVLPAT